MLLDISASASRARTLRWHSADRLKAFEGRLQAALQAWAGSWGLPAPTVVRCEPAGQQQAPATLHWQALAESADGQVVAWIGSATAQPADVLAMQLFGPMPPRAGAGDGATAPLADGLGVDAWQALCRTLTSSLPGTLAANRAGDQVAPSASDSRTWSGAIRATLSLGDATGVTCVLHAQASAIEAREGAPSRATPRTPLQALPAALARHHVTLQARLADVPVTLGDLMLLQAGDVLLTPHRLTAPLSVFNLGPSPQALHAAHLARRDGRTAIVLAPAGAPAPNDRLEGNPMSSNAPTAQWLGLPEAGDPPANAPALATATSPLLGVKTTLQVCVGEAVLTVGELTQARVGQVIKLDREVDGLVDLMLDGRVVARGQLVAVDDCFAVRLTELPLPLGGAASA